MGNGFIIPLSIDDKLSISKNIIFFAYQGYYIGDNYYVYSNDGFKNMILLLVPSYQTPLSQTYVSGTDYRSSFNIDGNLNTGGGSGSTNGALYIDYGSITLRKPSYYIGVSHGDLSSGLDGYCTVKVEHSTDAINWTQDSLLTHHAVAVSPSGFSYFQQVNPDVSCRYIRYSFSSITLSFQINELYDANLVGGTATVSFQALESSSNTWIDVIKGSDIGSYANTSPVAIQIGDALSQSNLNRLIASSFKNWRAKLNISGGGIKIGVSALLIK